MEIFNFSCPSPPPPIFTIPLWKKTNKTKHKQQQQNTLSACGKHQTSTFLSFLQKTNCHCFAAFASLFVKKDEQKLAEHPVR